MMKGKLAGFLVAVGALHSSVSLALGLGNMTVHSSLNQPLSADIKLVDVGDLSPDQIRVSLASPKEFERAGVERVFFLNNLHFDVVTSHGKYVIKVTTDKLVREPYLDFVLQVSWPSGRILRDYTVLVDLPKSAATKPAPSASTASTAATSAAYRQPAQPSSRAVSEASGPAQRPGGVSGDKVRVQRNDTLWRLSERVKPQNATVQQTMLAMQQANPRAFLRKNINGLQAGRVLRVPSEDEIHAVSRQQAVREVARQNHDWANGGAKTGKRQLEGGKQSATAGSAAPSSSGYMRLASAGDGAGAGAASKSGDDAAALQEQLNAAQENLDSAKRANSDLNSRVSALQKQIDTLKKLVQLKDSELATLQSQVSQSNKAEQTSSQSAGNGTAEAGAAKTQPAPQEASAPAPAQGGNESGAAATAGSAATKPATTQPPKVTVKQPPPSPSLLDKLSSNPMYEGLAAALVALLGFGWWYSRRNRAVDLEDDNDFLDTYEGESTADSETAEELVATETGSEQPDEYTEAETAVAQQAGETRPTTGDAIAEAEVYRSYGRDEDSRALLVTALQSEPERNDVRLKLMEYQVADSDRDGFREQYRALMERRDHSALAAAAALLAGGVVVGDWLEGLDHVEPESGPAETEATEAAEAEATEATEAAGDADEALDFDLDLDSSAEDLDATRPREALDLDPEMETALDNEAESAAADERDTGIDFSLDTDLETATDDTAEATASGDDGALEFDLSDLDLDIGDEAAALSADDIDLDLSPEIEQSSEDQAGDNAGDVGQIDSELAGELSTDSDATVEREALDAGAESAGEPEPGSEIENDFDFDLGDLDVDLEAGSAAAETAEGTAATAADIEVDTEAAMSDLDSLLQSDDDGELEGLGDADEVATKLDLARAYIDMGDVDGAREILDEVMTEGSDDQKEEASSLLANMTG